MTHAELNRLTKETLNHAGAPRSVARPSATPEEPSAASRKLTLLRRAGLFSTDLKGATIARATSFEDLARAYRLVHQIYVDAGYIHPDSSGMRLRMFETSSDMATFVAKVDGEVVGVISVIGDSLDLGLPSDLSFKPELDALRDRGLRLCEITNQVVSEEYRKSSITTELMRCAVAHSLFVGHQIGVATVSPSHMGFYELVGFELVGGERSYSEKIYDPVIAMGMDFDQYRNPTKPMCPTAAWVHQFSGRDNPYLQDVPRWERRARAQFLNPELLERMFMVDSDFLAHCTPDELHILQARWGRELFCAVAGSLSKRLDEPETAPTSFGSYYAESRAPFSFGSPEPVESTPETDRAHFVVQLYSAREMTLKYVPEPLPTAPVRRMDAWWLRAKQGRDTETAAHADRAN